MVPEIARNHRGEATKRLLIDLLKTASGLTIMLSKPAGSLHQPKYFFTNGSFDRTRCRRILRHAQEYGYITVKKQQNELTVSLNEAGRARAIVYSVEDIHIIEPTIWDKKWRMVLFDIPENIRALRKLFKAKLDEMGFAQIQKSVYVHPFPCHNEIELIRSLYGLESYIRLAVIDKLEGDEALRKRFSL